MSETPCELRARIQVQVRPKRTRNAQKRKMHLAMSACELTAQKLSPEPLRSLFQDTALQKQRQPTAPHNCFWEHHSAELGVKRSPRNLAALAARAEGTDGPLLSSPYLRFRPGQLINKKARLPAPVHSLSAQLFAHAKSWPAWTTILNPYTTL